MGLDNVSRTVSDDQSLKQLKKQVADQKPDVDDDELDAADNIAVDRRLLYW